MRDPYQELIDEGLKVKEQEDKKKEAEREKVIQDLVDIEKKK